VRHQNLLLAALLTTAIGYIPAQQAVGDHHPPLYREGHNQVAGVFIPPVAGNPFSATVVISSERPLPHGEVERKRTINQIARDSNGRIYNERRQLEPESFHGSPPLIEGHIFDPRTRIKTLFDPATHIARQRVLPEPPKPDDSSSPWVKVEDLGTTILSGLNAKGTRRTFTFVALSGSNETPVVVVKEDWYSEELHINLLSRSDDPRSGVEMIALSGIRRTEPPGDLFEVPAGYKTVDITPIAGSPGVSGGAIP
jgi:hypothetical protein